jgi:hypothetical protein
VFVIGNGESRFGLRIDTLPEKKIGCNAIVRDYFVDHLVCVDRRMVDEAQNYSDNFLYIYTRKDWLTGRSHIKNLLNVPELPYKGTTRPDEAFHWGSGPYAVLLGAQLDKNVKMIGFDLHSKDYKVNNIYKDTENYDPSNKSPVDPRYWIHQIGKVFECFPNHNFSIYCNQDWKCPKEWIFSNVSLDNMDLLYYNK